MKTGFCLHGAWLVERPELLETLDEVGCDGVEIWPAAFDAVGLEGVREIVAKYRFGVAALNPYLDFTASDESWRESVELAQTFLDYAVALGCDRVRTFTSKMGTFPTSEAAEPIHWERAIRGIREVADRAAAQGIQGVLEVHAGDGQLYDSSDSTLRILDGVDRPNVIVNLQPPLRGETPMESAERLGPYVQHLHAHNWHGGWGHFDFLDRGEVDFPAFLDLLRGQGFDGTISIEHATWREAREIARHEIPYLQGLIAARR